MTEAGERVKAKLVMDYLDAGKPQEVDVPEGDHVADVTDEVVEQLTG